MGLKRERHHLTIQHNNMIGVLFFKFKLRVGEKKKWSDFWKVRLSSNLFVRVSFYTLKD